jgi:hypothetical protein
MIHLAVQDTANDVIGRQIVRDIRLIASADAAVDHLPLLIVTRNVRDAKMVCLREIVEMKLSVSLEIVVDNFI